MMALCDRNQKRYKRFLKSTESKDRRFMVYQDGKKYICRRLVRRVCGYNATDPEMDFDIRLDTELHKYVHLTTGFKILDVKPPVVIWMLPDVINDLIREYATDEYEREYKKRRISHRETKQRDPVEVYF
jgi:hypothetical protein